MGTLTKSLTIDCIDCGHLKNNDGNKFICTWGKTKKGKLLLPKKGKGTLRCRLIESVKSDALY
jgi:hypothetical protein